MRKLVCLLICLGMLTLGSTAIASSCQTNTPDIIPLEDPAYNEHKKGIVQFNHLKHIDERTKSNDCGVCHHDNKGKSIAGLSKGDSVQRCIECHDKIGKPPKGTVKKDKTQWHQEAFHYQCKGCHRAYNKLKPEIKAPTTCKGCHPKKEK